MATRKKETERDRRDVYKAHQAIAVSPSPGSRITLLSRRFFNVLLQHAQAQAQRQAAVEIYRAPLFLILQDAGYDSRNYEVAKAALRGLAKTSVEWSIVQESASGEDRLERRWGVSSLVAQAEIIDDGGKGPVMFEWSYAPRIRDNMLDPSRYVQLDMELYATLSTGTAAALYEVCMQYLTNFNGLTNKAEWEWWRPRLTGFPDGNDGASYKFFKRDRLLPAILEINTKTDITVDLHEFKTARRITHLQFSSKRKAQASLLIPLQPPDDGLVQRLCALGFNEAQAAKIYTSTDPDALLPTLVFVEDRVKKGGVESPVALFRDALKKGYGAKEGEKLANTAKASPAKQASKRQDSAPGAHEPPRASLYEEAQAHIVSLSGAKRSELLTAFAGHIKGLVSEQYQKSGLKAKIVRMALLQYVHEHVLPAQQD